MTIEFNSTTDLLLGSDASILLTSDLNQDGQLDLVANFYDSSIPSKAGVAVFWGIGGGQFTAAQKYSIEQALPNLQYTFYQQQYQQYLQNYQAAYQNYQTFVNSLPPGTSVSPFTYPEFSYFGAIPSPTVNSAVNVIEIAVGDIDRDGKLDLITLGSAGLQQTSVISVLKGTGSGFAAAIHSPVSGLSDSPRGLVLADFNRDGNLDAAAIPQGNFINPSTDKQQVSILLGDGTGQFGNEKPIFLGIDPMDIITADFNGDGLTDLAITGTVKDSSYAGVSSKLSILLSDGAGGFSPPNTVSSETGSLLFTADFNSDGKIDLGSDAGFLAGKGNGQFGSLQTFQFSGSHLALGDFNGDGKLDIGGYHRDGYGPGEIGILLGDGTGNYTFPVDTAKADILSAIVSGDFDRDGKLDIAILNSSTKSISILLNRTTGSDLLVFSGSTIDASIEPGGLILDLKKGTLKVGGISKPLTGSYRAVRGSKQADRITGGQVRESLDGLAGDDVIVGGAGNDYLVGGFGNDILTGGKGKDSFVFTDDGTKIFLDSSTIDPNAPFNRAMGIDKITDFESGKDKINLYRDIFTAFPNRRISFEALETQKAAKKSKALITYIPKTGSLFYNVNGAKPGFGTGGKFADLTDGLELRAKDFLLT